MMLHALIMAGGGGTRFWPRSRRARPKQFLSLAGDRSLLQLTADRIAAQVPAECTWVMTSADHRPAVIDQLPHVPPEQIIGEPCSRDTAPCVALGAALVARRHPDAVLLVLPSDHAIEPAQEFRRICHAAVQLAQDYPQALVAFGITPTWPATGYGYIHRGEPLPHRQGIAVHRVRAFREKPDEPTARSYLSSGEYFWNAGVFVGRANAFLDQFACHQASMLESAQRIAGAWGTPAQSATLHELFPSMQRISFDFAVMEKCPEVLVLTAPYRWDDVGSWLALERLHPQDAAGNTVLARHIGLKTEGCIVAGEGSAMIATLGVSNLIIVHDGECFLVADKSRESEVKQLVEELRRRGLEQFL
jgi:mannose-1-phosphate guanylyltransferase